MYSVEEICLAKFFAAKNLRNKLLWKNENEFKGMLQVQLKG